MTDTKKAPKWCYMNITLKNIPNSLHAILKDKAVEHGRSLSKEIISTLESSVLPKKIQNEDFLDQVRKNRRKLKLRQTISKIESAIQDGRS